jgi:NitT/TauT family transport system permease protein
MLSRLPSFVFGLGSFALWEGLVRLFAVPAYILPGPVAIGAAFLDDAPGLLAALAATLAVTASALIAAVAVGLLLALLVSASSWLRAALEPWAVALQVTPIVAIAPLIIIWVGNPFLALVTCATIVAFFPVFSSTLSGLSAALGEHLDLFRLYGARSWQVLLWLRLPVAVPYFLAGLRISGGLSLVGAVVAEFVAGSGGFASGLAYRLLEAGYRLQIPRMFACLVLLGVAGLAINASFAALERTLARRFRG